ncbi:TIM-barrel signal transduction protein-domain-containing protein [Aspergillus oleicola]
MSPSTDHKEIPAHLWRQIEDGEPIVGAGAGTHRLDGEIGRFRMAGCGSLAGLMPYSNTNKVVVEMATKVIPIVQNASVITGVCGTDPFTHIPQFLKQLQELGFAGM